MSNEKRAYTSPTVESLDALSGTMSGAVPGMDGPVTNEVPFDPDPS